ncbi:MAG: aminoglycoside 6-adenylyltransferase [Planctomycetes bacterium]|nr:aminoglycoside 6-adenylyltransferase [Planctomycetota bacterium]
MLARQAIVEACHSALQALPHVRAALLAGSEAFGRADRWSDIDLNCVTPLAEVDRNFAAVEAALEQLSPIALKLVMPPSGLWPELAQCFYRLRDTDEFLMIDFCQMTQSQLQTFLEPTRHGTPVVLFDHDGLLKPVPLNRPEHEAAMAQRLQWLRASFPMFQNLVRKAVLRGDLVEAMAMWMGQTMRPLVEVLRMKHCPARYDYGFRYTTFDLPAPVAAELQDLMWPKDGADMLAKLERAGAMFAAVSGALAK